MATMKLYPPIIAGTTPPFYAQSENGAFKLKVPFFINKVVREGEVKGVKLKIRHADNDWLIHSGLDATGYTLSPETSYAQFDLSQQAQSMIVGHYYKIQLAYVDVYGNTGYFSTVSVTKCTNKPALSISGLAANNTNADMNNYIGTYQNEGDPSEKVYQYKFVLYDESDNEVESSGWLVHNSYTDTSSTESHDEYTIHRLIEENDTFKIQYIVETNNGLIEKSPKYLLSGPTLIEADAQVNVLASLDYDNGCVKISVKPKDPDDLSTYVGQFVLSRASAADDYKIWSHIHYFKLNGTPGDPVKFIDFTVEHGETYHYALQQFNSQGIYSKRINAINITPGSPVMIKYLNDWRTNWGDSLTEQIYEDSAKSLPNHFVDWEENRALVYDANKHETGPADEWEAIAWAWEELKDSRNQIAKTWNNLDKLLEDYAVNDVQTNFEDMYLYDGKRQLRVRFNPKVSSFKSVIKDTKKETLGSKYPFFFRNSVINYKEFPINGLISYLMDENEYFLSKEEILRMDPFFEQQTAIIDENIAYERRFKLEVLNWLNDGEPKLFRSPSEGNYLVRLLNVSLSPNDSLSRMIHSFSCTADELDAATAEAFVNYGLFNSSVEAEKEVKWKTINFSQLLYERAKKLNGGNEPTEADYIQAYQEIQSMNLLDGDECIVVRFEDCIPNTVSFTTDQSIQSIMIGASGTYQAEFDTPITGLYVQFHDLPALTAANTKSRKALRSTEQTTETVEYQFPQGNIFLTVLTTASSVFESIDTVVQKDILDAPASNSAQSNYFTSVEDLKHQVKQVYSMHFNLREKIYTIDNFANLEAKEQWYLIHSLVSQRYDVQGMPDYYATPIVPQEQQVTNEDLYIKDMIIRDELNGKFYQYKNTADEEDDPYYEWVEIAITSSDTSVNYNGNTIDLLYNPSLDFYSVDKPTALSWGSLVDALFAYKVLITTYAVEADTSRRGETSLAQAKAEMEEAKMYKDAMALRLQKLIKGSQFIRDGQTNTVVDVTYQVRKGSSDLYEDNLYFTWDGEYFNKLSQTERMNFSGDVIWTPVEYTVTPTEYLKYFSTEEKAKAASYENKRTIFYNLLAQALSEN